VSRSTPTVAIALTAVIVAACSGGSKKKTATVAPPAKTTTVPATTTTTIPPVSPLTGLPPSDGSRLGRPALVVKIDNLDPVARPQTGLTTADICIEEQVEGGITRFACIWQSSDAGLVGPVRSTRTTDIAIVSALNHPLYAFSGGSTSFLAQIRAAPIVDVGADAQPNAYFRFSTKPAPHNLFSRVTTLYGFVPKGAGPPPPQFVYRVTGQPAAAAGAGAATHADFRFPGVGGPTVGWDWDPASQKWKRSQNGSADVTTDGGQIAAANVIVEYVNYPIVGFQTIAGITGPIPMAQLVGQGQAWVLTGGVQVKANWSKPSRSAVTQFTDAAGAPIKLAPGQTWVELAPTGTPLNLR
jgi:Protein of unknown function (DUF3048) N-terminal domain/Protein of unknown function (DUF3048) C-terminal domain